MKDIVLLIPPPMDVRAPPLNMGYIASYLEHLHFNLKIIDLNIELYHASEDKKPWKYDLQNYQSWSDAEFLKSFFKQHKQYIAQTIMQIAQCTPKIIGCTLSEGNVHFAYVYLKKIKELLPHVKICVGGYFCTPEQILEHDIQSVIDYSIIGNAESTLPLLIANKFDTLEMKSQENIDFIYAKEEKEFHNDVYPTYKGFAVEKYIEKEIAVFSSKGCVAKCNFCIDWMQKPYAHRTAQNVVDEIQHHTTTWNIHQFYFRDLLINGDLQHLQAMCEEIIKRKLSIKWRAQAIARKMDDSLLDKLKLSGCVDLNFGVESCSEQVLKAMRKPFALKNLRPLLLALKERNILTPINLIMGHPAETKEAFGQTLEYIKENRDCISQIGTLSPCLLLPQSDLTQHKEKYDIFIPKEKGWLTWYTKDRSNTYDIRMQRIAQVVSLAKQLDIEIKLVHANTL